MSGDLVGRKVEWVEDLRPMPDACMGDGGACFDTSLIVRKKGTVVGVSRSVFGKWVALIAFDEGFIEIDFDRLVAL